MKPRVLIADDDSDLVDLLALHCEAAGFEVDTANNAMTALGKIEETPPDVVLLDVNMPSGNGLGVKEMMSHHEELRAIPVIMLTGSQSKETVRRCHDLCAYYVLKCPDVWSRIRPVLEELFPVVMTTPELPSEPTGPSDLASGPAELMDAVFWMLGASDESIASPPAEGQADPSTSQPWILSIEDDDDVAVALRMRLRQLGIEMVRATAGREGYRKAFLEAPSAILLDYELPHGNGDYVLRRLKESPATQDIPVVVVTGRREASIERQMRGLGATEFLHKPVDWWQLESTLADCMNFRSSAITALAAAST